MQKYVQTHLDRCVTDRVCHIIKVELSRARLVLGLVTIFGGYTIPESSTSQMPTQSGHPTIGR